MNSILDYMFNSIQLIEMNTIDYFTIALNILLLFFTERFIVAKDTDGDPINDYGLKVKIVKGVSLLFLVVFFISLFLGKSIGASWAQTYLVIMFSYLINHFINNKILLHYGYKKSVDEHFRYTNNYVTTVFSIVVSLSFILTAFFILIQIWNLKSLLENGSALVTIGFIIFATKEFWLNEVLSSIAIHAKGNFRRGNVVKLSSGETYVILETKLMGTRLKNLKTKVETMYPNKSFLETKVEIYSVEKDNISEDKKKDFKAISQFITFKIGYNTDYETVKAYFNAVMEEAKKLNANIGSYELNLVNNGDHAVGWELLYTVCNPYQLRLIKNSINLIAFNKQKEFNLSLSTPITHSSV